MLTFRFDGESDDAFRVRAERAVWGAKGLVSACLTNRGMLRYIADPLLPGGLQPLQVQFGQFQELAVRGKRAADPEYRVPRPACGCAGVSAAVSLSSSTPMARRSQRTQGAARQKGPRSLTGGHQ